MTGVPAPRPLPRPSDGVVAVLPVKRLAVAKSRLDLPGPLRRHLALAFALDAAAAALEAVDTVVVVTADAQVRACVTRLPVHLVAEPPEATLLAAVSAGVRHAHRLRPDATTVVVPADLPALTAEDLGGLVRTALGRLGADHPGAFVPDMTGEGTTLLVRPAGARVAARYGPGSALLHERAGVVRLADAPPGVRQDVDTLADLHAVRRLGVGAHTAAALRSERLLSMAATTPLLNV